MRRLAQLCTILLICTLPSFAQTQHDRIKSRGASTFDQFSNTQTVVISGATPSVGGGNVFRTNNGGSTTVTNFLGGVDSQQITVVCGDTNTTIQNNANIVLTGGTNYTCILNNSISLVFNSSANAWSQIGGNGSGGGGSSPGAPAQSFQCNDGAGHFVACAATDDGTRINISEDTNIKGPNPGRDIRSFGARTANPNITPYAVGLTASCVSGQTAVTISSASTFINGDGVVLYGCGAPHSMTTPSAPTVTPAISRFATRTSQSVGTPPTGTTTMNYKIVAKDKNGGLTAASVAGTTTTANTLGAQTVNITSCSRANDSMTCITAATHGFNPGCSVSTCGEVFIGGGNGMTDSGFRGWYLVSSVADGTHFTVANLPLDTRNGATTAATGGTATWFNSNRLTWTQVTGAWEYYFYCDRANSGTFTLCGISFPQGSINTDLTWDDYGSPAMDNFNFPPYVPSSPPASATSDNLSTTIIAGAGTTTLTLANSAGTSCPGAGCPSVISIRLDAAPGILAAATAASSSVDGGTVLIPSEATNNSFVVNSYLNLSSLNIAISDAGSLLLNETLETKARIYGDRSPQYGNQGTTATWQGNSLISVNTANPGIYNPQQFGTLLQGISLQGTNAGGNASLLALYEGGFNMAFIGDSFVTSTNNNDYLGIGLYIRGSAGQAGTNILIDRLLFSSGGPTSDGADHTPAFYCNLCGQGQIRSSYHLHRGDAINFAAQGGIWKIDHAYINGSGTNLFTVFGGANNWTLNINQVTMDTAAHPVVAAYTNGVGIFANSGNFGGGSGVLGITGLRQPIYGMTAAGISPFSPNSIPNRDGWAIVCGSANDGFFGPFQSYCNNMNNGAVSTSANYPIFVGSTVPAPSCAVSAGGSLTIGTYAFYLAPIWQNGGEGFFSPNSTACTTSSGNQTITITIPSVPGFPKALSLYQCTANTNGQCTGGPTVSNSWGNNLAPSTTSVVWTTNGANARSAAFTPSGGPTMLMPGTQGVVAPAYVTSDASGFKITEVSSGLTANRTVTKPDVTGFGIVTPELFTNSPRGPLQTQFPGALTTTWTGETFTLDKAITVTRVQVQLKVPPTGCSTNAVVRLSDGTTNQDVTLSAATNDSGAITKAYSAAAVLTLAVQTAASGCSVSPGDANVVVQYKMQ